MSKINPFLNIRSDLELAYSNSQEDFKSWLWVTKEPPKEEMINLLEEYYSRVLSEKWRHQERPSVLVKRTKSILAGARKIQANLRGPMGESQPFIDSWIEVNDYGIPENELAFSKYAEDVFSIGEGIAKLINACEHLIKQEATDIRKSMGAHIQWLTTELDQLYRNCARPDQVNSEQAAEFIAEVGKAFEIKLPETSRSIRSARKKIFD